MPGEAGFFSSTHPQGEELFPPSIGRNAMIQAIPEGYQTFTPTFVFKDARKAIEFYRKAFGAEERFVMPGPARASCMPRSGSVPR